MKKLLLALLVSSSVSAETITIELLGGGSKCPLYMEGNIQKGTYGFRWTKIDICSINRIYGNYIYITGEPDAYNIDDDFLVRITNMTPLAEEVIE